MSPTVLGQSGTGAHLSHTPDLQQLSASLGYASRRT